MTKTKSITRETMTQTDAKSATSPDSSGLNLHRSRHSSAEASQTQTSIRNVSSTFRMSVLMQNGQDDD
jgi:hypothetical protein